MQRNTDSILTTHTGSLPRPDVLRTLMLAKEAGESYEQATLEAQVHTAVAEIVRKQLDVGIAVVNDGEMSKFSFHTYVKDRLSGFEESGSFRGYAWADLQDFPTYAQRRTRRRMQIPSCTGPITYTGVDALQRDIANLKTALQGVQPEDAFLTAASPGVISGTFQNQYYPDQEAYLYALADAMKTEYEAIHQAGFLLQIDCPDFASSRHLNFAHLSLEAFRKQIALHAEVLTYALAQVPPERRRLHLCWGNYEGPHHRDVPLKDILDIALQVRPTFLSFETANPRHAHEWKVFQEVALPEGMVLMPGVIDSTTNFIEHPELVAERIVRFATLVGRENVIAGTDCGFASTVESSTVDPMIAWAKLEALVEGARLASQQLW